jgi:agmatinase
MELLNQGTPYNLFGIEGGDYKRARVVALPIPYDSTTSYRAGTRHGPRAIIDASRNIELYSEELGRNVSDIGIYTLGEMLQDVSAPEAMVKRIEGEVSVMLDDSKVPLLLGGEHSISIGAISAISSRRKDFSVLHFDAHSDSRDSFMGSRYSHASVMARARELCKSCYSVGVRSIDEEGMNRYKDEIMFRKDMRGISTDEIVGRILEKTERNIYLSIDLDVLDPSEMPSVGTPEPDGLHFYELSSILRGVLRERDILGMDMVELSPIPGLVAPDYLAAKLLYLTIGYAFVR